MPSQTLKALCADLSDALGELQELTQRVYIGDGSPIVLLNALHDRTKLLRSIAYRLHRDCLPPPPPSGSET